MTGCAESPFWLIEKDERGQASVLTTLAGGERTLPLFSFEKEALRFLTLRAPGGGWRARKVYATELDFVLRDSDGSLSRIALDPPPEPGAGALRRLASMRRESFLRLYRQEPPVPSSGSFREPQGVCLRLECQQRAR